MPFNQHLIGITRILLLNAAILTYAAESVPSVTSPDGKLAIEFSVDGGKLTYAVNLDRKPVLKPSALGLELEGHTVLGLAAQIVKVTPSEGVDDYDLVTGKTRHVHDPYRQIRLEISDLSGAGPRLFAVEARAYDGAVAFRYDVPQQAALAAFRLRRELTEFQLAKDATTHALLLPHERTMYEGEYVRLNASAFSGGDGLLAGNMLIGLPLLMQLPGVGWAALLEADLQNYSSLYLTRGSSSWGGTTLAGHLAQTEGDAIAVKGALPHHSAWRIILASDRLGALVESNVLTDLNPPSVISDTSWIKAGLSSWDWWSGSLGPDGKPSFSTATMKSYVDFAAQSGFPYMLIDAGWAEHGDITKLNGKVDVPAVVDYAKGKKVRVWIWLGYRDTDRQMEEAFALYEKWGVAGVKIDFIERDDQGGMDFYYRAAAVAAAHHLMVDFHGATKPSGIDRTYPNVLGYEAVLGLEQSRAGGRDNPVNRTTLPFTRMLVGRMDYTPGGFDNVTATDFVPQHVHPMVMGTRAAQLAMYVVYEAPFQMVSDSPQAYRDQPAFEFIRHAPASWDESRVLDGSPGDYISMARRSGNNWFLGCLTNWTGRDIDVPLAFLPEGRFEAEIYSDAEDAADHPKNVRVQRRTVDRKAKLSLSLAPGGGCAVRFVALK